MPAPGADRTTPFWREPLPALTARLGGPAGLSAAEVVRRRAESGPNTLRVRRERALALQFLLRFTNPLVLTLLGASALAALTGARTSLAIIAVMVLGSVTLDFVQEVRAGRAAERLRGSVAVRARVRRDGAPREVPIAEVVPGDVAELAAGDLIPADGRVLEAA